MIGPVGCVVECYAHDFGALCIEREGEGGILVVWFVDLRIDKAEGRGLAELMVFLCLQSSIAPLVQLRRNEAFGFIYGQICVLEILSFAVDSPLLCCRFIS